MVGFNRLPNELLWMVYENIDGIRDAPGRLCTDSRCLTGIDYFSNVAALTLLNRRCRDIFKPALFHCCGSVYAIRWAVQNKRIDVLQATLRHAGTPEVKRDLVNREAYICLEPVAFRHPPRERAVKWPLELACSRGYDDIVSLLLDAGADAAATSSRTISNPRHWYCLCMYSGMRQDNYQKMNPLRRAICSSHSSTALLLLQRNAPFPSVFQVSSGIYYPNVLHSAMAHGDVVLVDFLLRQLPDRVEEEQNRTYWPSCLSPLVKCGDHDAVRAIANLIMQNPVIQARSRQSKGESCHNAAVLAISCRNWATACALLETSPVALPADLTRECLMSRAQYDDSWTQQYQEFWPHFYGWGYDSEWDDQIRGSSESTPYMCYGGWITQPRDVRHWHIWRAKLVGKLLHTLNPSSPLGESSLVHFPLGRIPRRELDILLPVKATFTSLQWAIISEDILTLRTVIQTGPQQDLMPLEVYSFRSLALQFFSRRDETLQSTKPNLEILGLLLESGLRERKSRYRFDIPTGCRQPRCYSLLCLAVGRLGAAAISSEMREHFQRLFDLLMEKLTRTSITVEVWRHATATALRNPCSLSADICRGLGKLAARLNFAFTDTMTLQPAPKVTDDNASGVSWMDSIVDHGNEAQLEALLSFCDGHGLGIPTTSGVISPSAILVAAILHPTNRHFPERLRRFAGRVKDLGKGMIPFLGNERLLHLVCDRLVPYCHNFSLLTELLNLSDDWDFNAVDTFPENTPFMLLVRHQTPPTIRAIKLATSHGADPYLSTRSPNSAGKGGRVWDMKLPYPELLAGSCMALFKQQMGSQSQHHCTGSSAFEQAIWHRHDKIVKEILANTPPSSIKDAAIFSVLPIIKQCKQPNSGPWAARTSEFESGYRQQLHMETLAVRSIGLETPPHQLLFDIFEEAVKQFLLAPALAPARQHRTQHLLGLLTELISLGADVNQGIQGCCSSSRYLACNPPTRFCRSLAAQLNAYIHENRNLCYLINGYALFNLPLEHFKVVRWRLPQLANILRRTFTVVPASGSEGMSSASETATHQVVCHPEHVINPAAFLASQAGPDDEVGICDEVYLGVRLYGWTTARHFEAQSLSDIDTELRLSEGGLLHGHHQLAL